MDLFDEMKHLWHLRRHQGPGGRAGRWWGWEWDCWQFGEGWGKNSEDKIWDVLSMKEPLTARTKGLSPTLDWGDWTWLQLPLSQGGRTRDNNPHHKRFTLIPGEGTGGQEGHHPRGPCLLGRDHRVAACVYNCHTLRLRQDVSMLRHLSGVVTFLETERFSYKHLPRITATSPVTWDTTTDNRWHFLRVILNKYQLSNEWKLSSRPLGRGFS